MWVKTIVLRSPMRPASHAAAGYENAASRPEAKKKAAADGERHVELLEQPQGE